MKVSGSFAVVDENTFSDYDNFRKLNYTRSILVPMSKVLLHWMAESQCVVEEVKEYGHAYYKLNESEFEELAYWVREQQEKF